MSLFDKLFRQESCKKAGHSFVNGRCVRCGEVKGQYPITFSDDYWKYTLTFISPADEWIYCNTCHGYSPMLHVDCIGLKEDKPAEPKLGVIYPFPEKSYSICLIHEDSYYCPHCDAFVITDGDICKICGSKTAFHRGKPPQK